MKRRKAPIDIRTGLDALARDEFGGYLLTARMVSGVKVARAYRFDQIVSEAAALGARLGELQSSGRQMVGLLVSEAR